MIYDMHRFPLSLPRGLRASWVDCAPTTYTYGRAYVEGLTKAEAEACGLYPAEPDAESQESERAALMRAEAPHLSR